MAQLGALPQLGDSATVELLPVEGTEDEDEPLAVHPHVTQLDGGARPGSPAAGAPDQAALSEGVDG